MSFYSKLRRNIIESGGVYKVKDLFGGVIKEDSNQTTLLDDPRFYDISTKTLKLGIYVRGMLKVGRHLISIWVVNYIQLIVRWHNYPIS